MLFGFNRRRMVKLDRLAHQSRKRAAAESFQWKKKKKKKKKSHFKNPISNWNTLRDRRASKKASQGIPNIPKHPKWWDNNGRPNVYNNKDNNYIILYASNTHQIGFNGCGVRHLTVIAQLDVAHVAGLWGRIDRQWRRWRLLILRNSPIN